MKTLILIVAGTVALGSMAYGQTILKADIPFAFHASGAAMPAGSYTVTQESHSAAVIVRLTNSSAHRVAMAMGNPVDRHRSGAPRMTFLCTNDVCSLSEVRSQDGSISYPPSRSRSDRRLEAASVVNIPLTALNGE